MFDLGSSEQENNLNDVKYQFTEKEEMSDKEKLSMEKEMLGIYISGHPLDKIREQIVKFTNISSREMKEIDSQNGSSEDGTVQEKLQYTDGQDVRIAGIVTSVKKKYTKNNKIMAFVTIEDLNGYAEIIVFETTFLKYQDKLIEENIVLIKGRLSIREDDETKIVAQDIKNFGEEIANEFSSKIGSGINNSNENDGKIGNATNNDMKNAVKTSEKENVANDVKNIVRPRKLIIDITNINDAQKSKLRGAIRFFNGERNNIAVEVKVGEELRPSGAIYLTDEILKEFQEIVGADNLNI